MYVRHVFSLETLENERQIHVRVDFRLRITGGRDVEVHYLGVMKNPFSAWPFTD